MTIMAKVFRNGSSQAVRLPKECRFQADEVCVKRIGSAVVLFPKDAAWELMAGSLGGGTTTYAPTAINPGEPKAKTARVAEEKTIVSGFLLDTDVCVELLRGTPPALPATSTLRTG